MSEYIISTTNMPEHVRETLNAWCDVSGEIVRCRDCKYREAGLEPPFYCLRLGEYMEFRIDLDGFCKWGERNEDGKWAI